MDNWKSRQRGPGADAGRPARAPRPVDEEWIARAAAEHLARYSATRAHLKTLLQGRVRRAAQRGATVVDNVGAIIDATLDRHEALGTLNDAAWAERKARALTRRGVASSVVKQRLRQKGVPDATTAMETVTEELRDAGIGGEAGDAPAPDLVAACAWARRKHVGPFSRESAPEEVPTDRKEARAAQDKARDAERKLLASMGRAGFSFAISRRVLQMDLDEAETLLLKLR